MVHVALMITAQYAATTGTPPPPLPKKKVSQRSAFLIEVDSLSSDFFRPDVNQNQPAPILFSGRVPVVVLFATRNVSPGITA